MCRKKKSGESPEIKPQGRKTKIFLMYLKFLETYLSNPKNGLTSLKALRELLINKFCLKDEDISIYLVYKMIRKINFSHKKVQRQFARRNEEETISKRYELIQEIIKHLKLDRNFVFLDETGFNNFVIPIFGYSQVGKRLVYPVKPKSCNYSVLAAITKDGIIGY